MTLAESGGFLAPDDRAAVDGLRDAIVAGDVEIPSVPVGPLAPPPGVEPAYAVSVDYNGQRCRYDGPATVTIGDTLRLDLHNTTARDTSIVFEEQAWVSGAAVPVPAHGRATGHITISDDIRVLCFPSPTSTDGAALGAELRAAG